MTPARRSKRRARGEALIDAVVAFGHDRMLKSLSQGPAMNQSDPVVSGLLHFTFDGQELTAQEGQTIAAALLAAGRRAFRQTSRRGEPRGLFCGMGVCFDCLVCINGRPNLRACQAPVIEGMRVESTVGVSLRETKAPHAEREDYDEGEPA
jgi:hypothetical protein